MQHKTEMEQTPAKNVAADPPTTDTLPTTVLAPDNVVRQAAESVRTCFFVFVSLCAPIHSPFIHLCPSLHAFVAVDISQVRRTGAPMPAETDSAWKPNGQEGQDVVPQDEAGASPPNINNQQTQSPPELGNPTNQPPNNPTPAPASQSQTSPQREGDSREYCF